MDIKEATIQELNLELMRRATFNGFDGDKVVKSLNKHRDLWKSALMDGAVITFPRLEKRDSTYDIYWIKLRDLEDGDWNVDTVFVVPQKGKEDELIKLARRWHPDEIDYYDPDMIGLPHKILRIWWD